MPLRPDKENSFIPKGESLLSFCLRMTGRPDLTLDEEYWPDQQTDTLVAKYKKEVLEEDCDSSLVTIQEYCARMKAKAEAEFARTMKGARTYAVNINTDRQVRAHQVSEAVYQRAERIYGGK